MDRLISALLLKAMEDWKNPRLRSEVEGFMDSDWFSDLTSGFPLEPDAIRRMWKAGQFDHLNFRAGYRKGPQRRKP